VEKALSAMVTGGAIKAAQKKEIVELIDYRNTIAHQMHNILADLSPTRLAREIAMFGSNVPRYNYDAVKRLQHYHELFDGMPSYATTLNFNSLLFKAAE
jgi:hypothetical protein